MEAKSYQLNNKGMHKDISISKATNEFAYHNKNIRITVNGDESLLSITNEKGSVKKEIPISYKAMTKNLMTYNSSVSFGRISVNIKTQYETTSSVPFELNVSYGKQFGVNMMLTNGVWRVKPTRLQSVRKVVIAPYDDPSETSNAYLSSFSFLGVESLESSFTITPTSEINTFDTIYKIIPEESAYQYNNVIIVTDNATNIYYAPDRFKNINKFIYLIGSEYYVSENPFDVENYTQMEKTLSYSFPNGTTNYTLNSNTISENIDFSDEDYEEYTFSDTLPLLNDIEVQSISVSYTDDNFYYVDDINVEDIMVPVYNITGVYVGHCITSKYIILFCHQNTNNKDYIYRIEESNNEYIFKKLFSGNLDFSTDNILETLFYYESEDIQKVYWIDGVHQTRVINIMKLDYVDNYNNQFDFVPTVSSVPSVRIKKSFTSSGTYHSGIIQYFITYYNKFGAESHIIWGSALHYIAPQDRGGAPDEFISCSFTLNISNIDDKFEYMRIYSIKRQSLDGPVEANIVSDISIKNRKSIEVTDIGSNQESIDPNMINFLGGSNFVANTFAQKDDTLFLGNIKLKDSDLPDGLKEYITTNWIDDGSFKDSKRIKFDYKCFSRSKPEGFYPHRQQINSSSISFKGFKRGEIYRFAIQYQDSNGTWTQPIWIGDKECTLYPKKHPTEDWTMVPTAIFERSDGEKLDNSTYNNLIKDYIAYRLLMAKTDYSSRSIVTQGIVCPTMFNYKERTLNKPYSISSYLMRPREGDVEYRHFYPVHEIYGNRGVALPNYGEAGTAGTTYTARCVITAKVKASYYYWEYFTNLIIYVQSDQGAEKKVFSITDYRGYAMTEVYDSIMNAIKSFGPPFESDLFLTRDQHARMHGVGHASLGSWTSGAEGWNNWWYYRTFERTITITDTGNSKLIDLYLNANEEQTSEDFNTEYYVDESILTFNSPDLLDYANQINQSGLSFRLVGIAPITASKSDYRIYFTDDSVVKYKGNLLPLSGEYYTQNLTSLHTTLTSDYIYSNAAWKETSVGSGKYYRADQFAEYRIYMWHKEGSLCGASKNMVESAESDAPVIDYNIDILDDKLFSTEKFSIDTEYFSFYNIGISKPEVFNSDGLAISRVELPDTTGTYYGNYQTSFIPRDKTVPVKEQPSGCVDIESNDLVSINYNSTPHAVFSLLKDITESDITHKQAILLPKLKSDSDYDDILSYTFLKPDTGLEISTAVANGQLEELKSYGIFRYTGTNESFIMYDVQQYASIYISRIPSLASEQVVYALVSNSALSASNPIINYVFKLTKNAGSGYDIEKKTTGFESCVIEFYDGGNYAAFDGLSNTDYFQYNQSTKKLSRPQSYLTHSYARLSDIDYETSYPYLFIGELFRQIPYSSLYGGYDENAIEKITWIPICSGFPTNKDIYKTEGDTYYQRWDCVKTTPGYIKGKNSIFDITSVMLESHICLDGRYDKNRGGDDILNISSDNFNLFNPVYNQSNNLFAYNILDDKYDLDTFENQVLWSKQKDITSDIDTWTNISQLNSIYLDGQYGGVNKLVNYNDTIVAFQDKAIAAINFNNQTQISTEQGLPIEVVNSGKVTGYNYVSKINGCHNKWSINESTSGLFFIDDYNKSLFRFNKDGLTNLSTSLGFSKWFKDNISGEIWNPNNSAFRISSDKIKHDVYIINKDNCLCYNEDTATFTSFYTEYKNAVSIFNLNGKTLYFDKNFNLYEMFAGDYLRDFSVEYKVNPEPLEDKIFTNIEYISDTIEDGVKNKNNPFKTLIVNTEYQNGATNLLNNNYPNSASKFRLWRGDIPRDSVNKLDRIRNPWINLKLIGNDIITGLTTLHSLVIKYFK